MHVLGPLTIVPLTKQPATLDSLKSDCQKHFRTSAACYVLQGQIFIFFKGGVEKLLVGCKRHH